MVSKTKNHRLMERKTEGSEKRNLSISIRIRISIEKRKYKEKSTPSPKTENRRAGIWLAGHPAGFFMRDHYHKTGGNIYKKEKFCYLVCKTGAKGSATPPKNRRTGKMALSRSWLAALGIEEAKVDEIVKANAESISGLKTERDELREQLKELPELKRQLEEAKAAKDSGEEWEKKYNDLKADFDSYKTEHDKDGDLKEKYDALKAEYETFKKDTAEKAEADTKSTAFTAMLKDLGIAEKYIPSILKVTDLKSLKLDKDGALEDLDKLKQTSKEAYSDFIVKERQEGAGTSTPPGGGATGMTKEEIISIQDPIERQQKIAENHELFGF
jgi:hypothetical protein